MSTADAIADSTPVFADDVVDDMDDLPCDEYGDLWPSADLAVEGTIGDAMLRAAALLVEIDGAGLHCFSVEVLESDTTPGLWTIMCLTDPVDSVAWFGKEPAPAGPLQAHAQPLDLTDPVELKVAA